MNKLKIIFLAFMAVAIVLLSVVLKQTVKEKNRLYDNQTSLLQTTRNYKTLDSLNAASVEKLTLSNKEFKTYNSELVKTVESLNLKVRWLQSVSQTGIITEYLVKTEVKDSLIYTSSIPDTIKCINHKETWIKLAGCIQNKIFTGIIEIPDTLVTVVHRVPRNFLFIKYGTKAIRQDVISKNPHTKIVYAKYIELKR